MTTIGAIIPTFNEEALLRVAVKSLVDQEVPGLKVLVINAGRPLSKDLLEICEEIAVPSDFFWTACIEVGFKEAVSRGLDFVMLANADTTLLAGSINALVEVASKPDTVACSPGYLLKPDDSVELLYSGETFLPFLYHFRIEKAWNTPADAPAEPYEVPVVGGQGVMFSTSLLKRFWVDPIFFPQAKGDHDLWLSMREKGIKLMMVPKAGAVNLRAFGELAKFSRKKRLKKLWWRATAQQSNDSWRVMWAMRKKHMALPMAIASFGVMFPWRQVKGIVDALK